MNKTILVVDDVEENRDILGRILERKGFEVSYAEDGRQAVDSVTTDKPGLILMDINMPEMDGFEACRQIKADPDSEKIPIIFISARSDAVDKLEAFSAGGVDYVTKPFDFREVIARVNTHVELRHLQQTLEEKNRELEALEAHRDHLTSLIVHDMRTPLSVISTSMELMGHELADKLNGETREDFDNVRVNAGKLLEMVDNVLQVRKLQSTELQLAPEPHDVSALARDLLAEMELLTAGHEVALEVPGTVEVSCDGDLLRRMLSNLLSNALKAMSEPGKITLTVRDHPDRVQLSVADTGCGIPEEKIGQVFDSHAQGVSEGGYETKKSTGLGLSMCRLAAEAHGGSIDVQSTPGEGTVFTIELPR